MKVVLVGKTMLKKKQYSMDDSDGVVQKAHFGLDDSFYGGSLKEFRKTKNSGIMLCIGRRDSIINLAYVEENLTEVDRKLLGLEPILPVDEVDEVDETDEVEIPVEKIEVPKEIKEIVEPIKPYAEPPKALKQNPFTKK